MLKTLASLVIAGLLVLGAPTVSSASVTQDSTCAKNVAGPGGKLDTFKIDLKLGRRVHRPGDVVEMKAFVTRRGPLGTEDSVAAEIEVTAALSVGEMYLVGYGVTDEYGLTTIKIKTWDDSPTKWGHLRFIVCKQHFDDHCHVEVAEETIVKLHNAVRFRN